MNATEIQTTVVSMPVVQMNVDHIHASVTMDLLEMALSAVRIPVLQEGNTSA